MWQTRRTVQIKQVKQEDQEQGNEMSSSKAEKDWLPDSNNQNIIIHEKLRRSYDYILKIKMEAPFFKWKMKSYDYGKFIVVDAWKEWLVCFLQVIGSYLWSRASYRPTWLQRYETNNVLRDNKFLSFSKNIGAHIFQSIQWSLHFLKIMKL